jgi:type II secretory pathway component PulF
VQPGSRSKSQFFHELCQLTRAGIPLPQGLEMIAKTGGPARAVSAAVARGEAVAPAFRAAGFSVGECAVIEAGETSGRLDHVFAELAEHHKRLAAARAQIVARSLYPVFVIHFAALLLPIAPAVLTGDFWEYVRRVVAILAGFYLVLLLVWTAGRGVAAAFASSASAGRLLAMVPVLGRWLVMWCGARFASTFSLYLASGGGILRGIEVAGRASGSALLAASVAGAAQKVKAGAPLGDSFRSLPGMPAEVSRAVQLGDQSGHLDRETARAASDLTARSLAGLEALAEWTPRILYTGVVLFVGWSIIQTALRIGAEVGSVLDL